MAFHLRKLLDELDPDSRCQKEFCDPKKNLNGSCPPNCMNICPDCCRTSITATPTPPQPPPPPPPPPDYLLRNYEEAHKHSTLSNLLTVSLAILATSFFFFACYVIYKIFLTWYNSRRPWRSRSSRIGNEESGPEEFLDVDNGPVVDHPIWYIRTVGLDPSVISSIAIVKYEKGGGLIEGTDCSVCLSEFQENESLRLLPQCNHAFHIPCIDTWLRAHTNCPMCRARIVSNTAPISSSENVIVLNSGGVEETNEAGASAAENEDSDLRVRIEEAAPRQTPVGLKMNEIYGVENGIQPTRRSVSMDSLSASVVRKAIANASSAQSDETSCLESVEMKETNGVIVEKSAGINRNLLRLVGSSSSSRLSRTVSSSMKRSASCSARVLLPRYSGKSWNPVIPP